MKKRGDGIYELEEGRNILANSDWKVPVN